LQKSLPKKLLKLVYDIVSFFISKISKVKTIEERKKEVENWCKINYDSKYKWWKSKNIVYTNTRELVPNIDNFFQIKDSFFIKKSFRFQLLGIVFSIVAGLFFLNMIFESANTIVFTISVLLFTILNAYLIYGLYDKEAKIVLTKDCFFFKKMEAPVPWNFLAASYVKEETIGDNYYEDIVLHYYNKNIDAFVKFEYRFNILEMDIEDICFHIEKFKEKSLHAY
jgi:hypothetical protein